MEEELRMAEELCTEQRRVFDLESEVEGVVHGEVVFVGVVVLTGLLP